MNFVFRFDANLGNTPKNIEKIVKVIEQLKNNEGL